HRLDRHWRAGRRARDAALLQDERERRHRDRLGRDTDDVQTAGRGERPDQRGGAPRPLPEGRRVLSGDDVGPPHTLAAGTAARRVPADADAPPDVSPLASGPTAVALPTTSWPRIAGNCEMPHSLFNTERSE